MNIAGRRVRQLADRTFPAGPSEVQWDGRDAEGRRLSPGVYFVRLEAEAGARTRKILLSQ